MNWRSRGVRASLVGAAFLTGIGISADFNLGNVRALVGGTSAFAQATVRTNTYRLLALFGNAFEQIRNNYVDPVSDKDLIENAIDGMLTGLDPHSAYMNANEFREMQTKTKGEFGGIGIEVIPENGFIKVGSVMDGTPASKAGIKTGDIITALNGKSVEGVSLNDLLDQTRGPPNTMITLTIEREGFHHPLTFSLRREIIQLQVVWQRMEPGNIGYVRLTGFTEQADASLKRAIASLKEQASAKLRALILDLRNNPGGLLDQAVAVAGEFIVNGEVVSTRARQAEDSEWLYARGREDILGGAPLVLLINSGSASASEIVAGALQDRRRAVIVGTRSFGKGSVQTLIPLPNGGALRLTTARYYTPSGRSIQGRGITPDVLVRETYAEELHFDPEHEGDLNHALKGTGGNSDLGGTPRADLPSATKMLRIKPPKDFPAFDPAKPDETDFQLQQAVAVAQAMAAGRAKIPAKPTLPH